MKTAYITVTGMNYRYGTDFMEKGMTIRLVKEPDNEYDHEAIMARLPGLGKIGYVANSWRTVNEECMSAGRLYDKIADEAEAEVLYVLPSSMICVVKYGKEGK